MTPIRAQVQPATPYCRKSIIDTRRIIFISDGNDGSGSGHQTETRTKKLFSNPKEKNDGKTDRQPTNR